MREYWAFFDAVTPSSNKGDLSSDRDHAMGDELWIGEKFFESILSKSSFHFFDGMSFRKNRVDDMDEKRDLNREIPYRFDGYIWGRGWGNIEARHLILWDQNPI